MALLAGHARVEQEMRAENPCPPAHCSWRAASITNKKHLHAHLRFLLLLLALLAPPLPHLLLFLLLLLRICYSSIAVAPEVFVAALVDVIAAGAVSVATARVSVVSPLAVASAAVASRLMQSPRATCLVAHSATLGDKLMAWLRAQCYTSACCQNCPSTACDIGSGSWALSLRTLHVGENVDVWHGLSGGHFCEGVSFLASTSGESLEHV